MNKEKEVTFGLTKLIQSFKDYLKTLLENMHLVNLKVLNTYFRLVFKDFISKI